MGNAALGVPHFGFYSPGCPDDLSSFGELLLNGQFKRPSPLLNPAGKLIIAIKR